MEEIIIEAEKREIGTKNKLNVLRSQGSIPAVIYGAEQEPLPLSVDEKKISQLIHSRGSNLLIDLKIKDVGDRTVLIKEMQRDPIKRKIIHIDFHQVSLKEKIEVTVPLQVQGDAPGVKAGGVLEHIFREIKVRCLPRQIPQSIPVDVSKLNIGEAIFVKDLSLPKGVELVTGAEQIVINVVSPTILEEVPVAAAAEVVAEPEVIGKGKKEEEEEVAEVEGKKETKETKETKEKK